MTTDWQDVWTEYNPWFDVLGLDENQARAMIESVAGDPDRVADAVKEFCVRLDENRDDPYRRIPGTPREALRIALARLRAVDDASIPDPFTLKYWATAWFGRTAAEDLGDRLLTLQVP